MTLPTFFAAPTAFRRWLQAHAASSSELIVGFHKVASGQPCMTWSESVDEALCFGWIDGVRRRIDDHTYSIRFTPRKPSSIWSAVNIAKMEQLQTAGRVTPAGLQAFAHRKADKSAIYSHEQVTPAELPAPQLREFQRHKKAWQFFETTLLSYQRPCCTGSRLQSGLKRGPPDLLSCWRLVWRGSVWTCGPVGGRLLRRSLQCTLPDSSPTGPAGCSA